MNDLAATLPPPPPPESALADLVGEYDEAAAESYREWFVRRRECPEAILVMGRTS